MEAEIVQSTNLVENTGDVARDEKGRFLHGGPQVGRPLGAKNKFTMVKEALVDAFNDAGGAEAFKNTLIHKMKNDKGEEVKFINLKALNAVLRVLPREESGSGNTYNFNLVVAELRRLGPDELRSIIARRPRNVSSGGGEGVSS